MPGNIDNKQLDKAVNRVKDLLEKCRLDSDSKDEATHQSYGTIITGKFKLDRLQRKELLTLYTKALFAGATNFSIIERQKEYAPILVDIDLEKPVEDVEEGTRLYDDSMVETIIQKYIDAIKFYLEPAEHQFNVCFFEKSKPKVKEDDTIKDGFHLFFPDLCVATNVRHLIRHHVVKSCEDDELFEGFLKPADKVIDKAVVSSNGWLLYGSRKPGCEPYFLSRIYNGQIQMTYNHETGMAIDPETGEEYEEIYDYERLVKYFSIQSTNMNKKFATPLSENFTNSDINAECDKVGINDAITNDRIQQEIPSNKEDDIRRAMKYASMLSEKRAYDYEDWIQVGFALHSVDSSLLPAWIEFSQKCTKKYKDGECEKKWYNMKTPPNGCVLTIRSLAYWAKQDNPKEYETFNREEFRRMMSKSLEENNMYYLAKSVHAKYADKFVCSDLKSNVWWEFKNHRWNRVIDAFTLKILLSEDFANEYNKKIAEISLELPGKSGFEKERMTLERNRLTKITEKLMNTNFKETLIKECKNLFYDNEFEQKLDSNIFLMGFENGVFDFERGTFREGRPDDYITYSTKNDYYKWTERSAYTQDILKFFEQIFPNPVVRKYFISALCTCVTGETNEQKLYILNGEGSNGKSKVMDLMSLALGDYYMSCPITVITKKRGNSNETSPEKVRMRGRRCGVFQETDDGEKLNVGVMKEFTGGDKVLVRDLFKGSNDMIEFKPQMKYFLTCNQLPTVPSNDDGTWRRLRVLEFVSKFTDKPTKENHFPIDKKLNEKLQRWAPTFISYLVHLYLTEYKNKELEDPIEVSASTDKYKMENDFFAEYLNDKLVITGTTTDKIGTENMWEHFKEWYKKSYEKGIPKRTEFIKFISKSIKIVNKNMFVGVQFNIPEVEEPTNELDL